MKISIILGIVFMMQGCGYFPPDNPLEEFAEEQIEKVTGIDIDFTPNERI